jgi:hypothetical protein
MIRRTPMNRGTGFKRPGYAARPAREQDDTPSTAPARSRAPCNAVMTPVRGPVSSITKENPARNEAYRRLVAARPCKACSKPDRSQHAHLNEGKGKALKLDDRQAMPLCCDEPGAEGCHTKFDQYRLVPGGREAHIALGRRWAAETRAEIVAAGQWPKNLPRWPA